MHRWLNVESKDHRSLHETTARTIERLLGIADGALDSLGPEWAPRTVEPVTLERVRDRGLVPLISWVRAGAWSEVEDPYAVGQAEEWLPCPVKHGPRTFVLRVSGVSMENPGGRPSFSDGDLIFVDPERDAIHRSIVVVRIEATKKATLKQLIIESDRRYLKALNPAWPEPIIEVNGEATVVGVVIFKGEAI